MPTYRVNTPWGTRMDVTVPEGKTEKDAYDYLIQEQAKNQEARSQAVQEMKQDVGSALEAPVIAAGRSADKVVQGFKEMGLGAQIAAKELPEAVSGLRFKPGPTLQNNGGELRQMAGMDQAEAEKDAAYAPLREKHPFLTGLGEALPAMAPGGQATMLGRVAAPAIAYGLQGALSYGSPEERAKAGLGNLAIGSLGGGVGEIARSVVAPARSALSGAQQKALENAASKIGYKPRASDLTGSETLRRMEDAVARQPGGAGPMREFMDQNDRAISRHLAKGIGEDSDALTSDVLKNASTRISGTYEDMKGRASMPVQQPIFDSITKAEGMLTKGDVTGPKKDAYDMLQRLKDDLYQSKQFDGETYQSWSVDLGAKSREFSKSNRTAAAALSHVEKTMDREARGADAPLWAKTDKQNAQLEMLMKPGVVDEVTGKPSPRKLASQMERQFGKAMKTGKITGENADVAALARAFPAMAEGSQTAGREAFGSLPGWMLAGPNYALAKTLSSEAGREYLAKGLLGHPGLSSGAGGLLGRSAVPLTIEEIQRQLLGYQ